jgi:chitinase
MAYDLHGFWDSDVEALGSVVRGQANIEDIANTIPLAYAGVDPSKITIGIAWYGRGYSLADPFCNTLGCSFLGPNKAENCTNSTGVLSLIEDKEMIAGGEAKSKFLPDIGMMELV